MIWFTSDTHAYHKNIAGPSVSEWKKGYRNFNNEIEMTDTIVETFNKYVKKNDELYHIGDWSFGGIDNIWKFRKQLNVEVIHLIFGNHDNHIIKNKQIGIPVEDHKEMCDLITYDPYKYYLNGKGFQSSNTKNLFSTTHSDLIIEKEKQTFHLNHYAKRIWFNSNKGGIHLYGHSHGSMPEYGKSMDVGIDVAYRMFGEYRPFSITEILSIMESKEIAFPDHHNLNTNTK